MDSPSNQCTTLSFFNFSIHWQKKTELLHRSEKLKGKKREEKQSIFLLLGLFFVVVKIAVVVFWLKRKFILVGSKTVPSFIVLETACWFFSIIIIMFFPQFSYVWYTSSCSQHSLLIWVGVPFLFLFLCVNVSWFLYNKVSFFEFFFYLVLLCNCFFCFRSILCIKNK